MELSKHFELLSETDKVNRAFDATGNLLCLLCAEVEKTEAFKELGYDSANAYVIERLKKSKGNASMLLTVGRMALEAGFTPQTVEEIEAPYFKLYAARSEVKNGFDSVLAHALTLNDQELKVKRLSEKAGKHEPQWKTVKICEICSVDEFNHD